MATVEIYTWSTCPYCQRAKALLNAKDVDFKEYDITGDDSARAKMVERTGGPRTVPQIFINGRHVGGCDDIHLLEEKGELDALLAQ